MAPTRLTRADQRTASTHAMLDAAVEQYALHGPNGTSLRAVAQSAGLTHALVKRYFGSKQGLVAAVERRLVDDLRPAIGAVDLPSAEAFADLLAGVRALPFFVPLLVRCGLGDLDSAQVADIIGQQCSIATAPDRRSRLCGYAAVSLILGWLSWDGFLVPAVQLGRVSRRRQDEAMAGAAASLLHLASCPRPALRRRLRTKDDRGPETAPPSSAREALLRSAVELFAQHGPASVSLREVARHAGVNHGLIHRHFGSKDDLLAEAIEAGSTTLQPGALAPDGFDIDDVVHSLYRRSPSARTIARVLVDDIEIERVRQRYPVAQSLLAFARRLPPESRPTALADPRLASAAAVSVVVGSAIWGEPLRAAFGVDDEGVEAAIADLGRWLLGASPPTRP